MKGEPPLLAAYLVRARGDDAVLLNEAVHELVHRLVGDEDPALVVEELADDDYEVTTVVAAAQTPPFLTRRRVVVARGVGRFGVDDIGPLVSYLADPLPTTSLVLVGGGGQVSQKLVGAVKKAGEVIDASAPEGSGRRSWVAGRIRQAAVRLDPAAAELVAAHLGEDVARVGALLSLLEFVYGDGAGLGVGDVEPFLGEAGGVAPWELTDAIDAGNTEAALTQLRRMLGGGDRHPLVVLASLHNHYTRILRLDGAGCADEASAAAVLGLSGSTFPAKKALVQSRRLGHEGVVRAVALLAEADLALKGAIDWPGELVLEVLVARLSRLGRAGRSQAPSGRRSSGSTDQRAPATRH